MPVPIVPAAILYDLSLGDPSIRPDRQAGYRACQNATTGPVEEGNVGAGAGATAGKLLGKKRAMKGGLGSASLSGRAIGGSGVVAVNASGDVIDPKNGRILAGARNEDGQSFANMAEILRTDFLGSMVKPNENTSLGVVATNASFDKAACRKSPR